MKRAMATDILPLGNEVGVNSCPTNNWGFGDPDGVSRGGPGPAKIKCDMVGDDGLGPAGERRDGKGN